ncbi:FAD-dependent thymidylate synthase [bacterium]|nr:FAD-dependent thymidylate synthase [bacterium]
MARNIIPEAEALIDQPIPVLDKGFVRLVDYLGGDARIVQAARVSYGAGTKSVREDKALIAYLYRNAHTSPFEQVQLTFHVKLPVFVARQWVRHRTARLNELSGRYSVMRDEFYVPDPSRVQFQSSDNKQGSGESMPRDYARRIVSEIESDQTELYAHYESMLGDNMARELARINLPLSLYTEWYWQIDLHNLFHFLRLRLDPHAQYEIRVYGEALGKCARAVAPWAWEAFEEYGLHGVHFSRTELRAIRELLASASLDQAKLSLDTPPSELSSAILGKMTERKRGEFFKKLWKDTPGVEEPEFKPARREEL